jgi:hypothetical protein
MKQLFIICFMISLSSSAQPPPYISLVGLVAWYPFNGNTYDESGNQNDGTAYHATLTADRFGNMEKAFYFNGTSAYIDCGPGGYLPGRDIFNLNNYTICAWVKTASSNGYKTIVAKEGGTSVNRLGYAVDIVNNQLDGANNGMPIGPTNNIVDSNWNFVAFTYDGSYFLEYNNTNKSGKAYSIKPEDN